MPIGPASLDDTVVQRLMLLPRGKKVGGLIPVLRRSLHVLHASVWVPSQ